MHPEKGFQQVASSPARYPVNWIRQTPAKQDAASRPQRFSRDVRKTRDWHWTLCSQAATLGNGPK
jgi:hypothetical protein